MRGGRGSDGSCWIELAGPYLVLCISMMALARRIKFNITILHVNIVDILNSIHLRVCQSFACWVLRMCDG